MEVYSDRNIDGGEFLKSLNAEPDRFAKRIHMTVLKVVFFPLFLAGKILQGCVKGLDEPPKIRSKAKILKKHKHYGFGLLHKSSCVGCGLKRRRVKRS